MGDTTGNQDLTIATNGTTHVAMTMGATDVCKLPNNTPVPFPNFIASKGNVQAGTTNTFIAKQSVWIERSNLGPTSDPAHAGVNKGVASGTYRGIAKATSWSKDVQMEGMFVVRTGDPTTQNNANTTGSVMGSNMMAKVEAQDEYKKLLCTIVKLEGKCGHGRELGPPPGAPKDSENNYLEILMADTVEFISTRENLVTRDVDPGCEKGIHTHWEAKASGGVFGEAPKPESKDSLKKYTLGGELTGVEEESAFTAEDPEFDASNVKDYTRRKRMKAPDGTWAHDGGAVTNKPRLKADKDFREAVGDIKDAVETYGEIKDAILWWDAGINPRVITVEASACSGKKTATIKVLPKDKLTVDLFTEKLKAAAEWLQKALKLVERVTSFFGVPAKIEFLVDPNVKLHVQYKELTADKGAKTMGNGLGTLGPYWKVQARRCWSLEFSFNPLIGGMAKFSAPIASALPAIGAVAATIMKWVGAKGDVFVKIEIQLAPKVSVNWTEYDDITVTAEAELKIVFEVGLEIYVQVAEATVSAYIEGTITLDNWGPRPGYLLATDANGELQLGIKGSAKASFWGIEYSQDFEYKPECLKWGTKTPIVLGFAAKPSSGGTSSP